MSDAADRRTRQLDTTGTFCPLPILLAARELMRMAAGERLEIVGDDPAILEDMPVWCERAGHRLVEMAERGGKIVSLVEKGSRGRQPPEGTPPPERGPKRGANADRRGPTRVAGGGRGRAAGGRRRRGSSRGRPESRPDR